MLNENNDEHLQRRRYYLLKIGQIISVVAGNLAQHDDNLSFDVSSCEVIKDQKTGESLQYAFIEFEKVSRPLPYYMCTSLLLPS